MKYLPQTDALNCHRHSEYAADIFHRSYFRVRGSGALIARSHDDVTSPEETAPAALIIGLPVGLLTEKDGGFCMCTMPCNLTRYNKELSMVKIPSKTSAKYLEKKFNKSEKYITENILVLDVFFEALNYETIEQKKAYEVAGLLGDIGGQMGLFIGASILTILELFDYIYEVS
ncbi:hypothetical protein AB205_0051700 [Aquarana catesbeiana]|uniref:Uncharacterized protein n=1 Tax=Aquarana catesbeiana TaxID=8400 RepID=A0A2G9SDP5_AQUCT|nr:hypothetical protein AB205_0051700 [Aquarana catesbeiana]